MVMEHADRATRQDIACLRQCSAIIHAMPALWPLWWPVVRACEAEAARLQRTLARRPDALADAARGDVVDFGEWRRRKVQALGCRQPAGDAA
jgi:hypothetical protein